MQRNQVVHVIHGGRQILCPGNRSVESFCNELSCRQSIYICRDPMCNCGHLHRNCNKHEKQYLLDLIQTKFKHQNDILEGLENKLKRSKLRLQQIQRISTRGMRMISNELIGMNQHQANFFNLVISGNQEIYENITRQQIHQVYLQSKLFKFNKNLLQRHVDSVHVHLDKLMRSLYDLQNTIKNDLDLNTHMVQSQIVMGDELRQIQHFFLQQGDTIRKFTLLFRGSQHDFQVSKFHEFCDGQTNTLTICWNEHDKKIGGFTPIAWRSETQVFYQDDISRKSFVFNLTNNHKFLPQKNKILISCSQQQGPCFGNGDFKISNRCHQNFESLCALNKSFYNGAYTSDDQNQNMLMNMVMTGSISGNFRAKQYEIWKVEFQPTYQIHQQSAKHNQPQSQKLELMILQTPTPLHSQDKTCDTKITQNPDLCTFSVKNSEPWKLQFDIK